MRSELSNVLERGAERPTVEPDFVDLARKGRRRRYAQRTSQGLAVVAVIALTAGVVLPRLRPPEVMFDSGPRGGVGTWEAVPPAPIGARHDAMTATDGRRVVVFGGTETDAERGDIPRYDGAVYDTRAGTWTTIAPLPVESDLVDPDAGTSPDHMELLDDGRLLTVYESRGMVAFYDFASQTWEEQGAELDGIPLEFGAWTGSQVIMFGPGPDGRTHTHVYTDGEGWRIGQPAQLSARLWASTAWTGDRLLVWGGVDFRSMNGDRERVLDDGAAYDPVNDTWESLPVSPLDARQSAESVWTGEEWIVMSGSGASTASNEAADEAPADMEVTEECNNGLCTGTATAEGGAEPVFEGRDFSDGARYNPATGSWAPVALPPKGAREYVQVAGDTFEAQGNRKRARYDVATDTWRTLPALPNTYNFDAIVHVGSHQVEVNTTRDTHMAATDRPRRIGGQVYNEQAERWDPLAEAETPQRWGAAVTPVGDNRYFVWGGVSVTRDISGGYTGGEGVWKYHDDGALLTLD